ncbi:hypothetical protein [Streptomyces triticiradicis]|uniref:hypothetical protein n=1 Tax=Streptomyces triticiradicis TaxID=2651189 RepID=UPI001788A8FC|nr:hypothetical protein [Streptomyces triticiradicis]
MASIRTARALAAARRQAIGSGGPGRGSAARPGGSVFAAVRRGDVDVGFVGPW